MAIFRFLDSGFGLLASFVMSFGMTNLGWKFYIINASYDVIFLVAIYFLWVETARVPLEEIALRFGDLHLPAVVEGEENDRSDEVAKEQITVKHT